MCNLTHPHLDDILVSHFLSGVTHRKEAQLICVRARTILGLASV